MSARLIALCGLAMTAFAANSVLARLALVDASIGAAGYTGVRLLAGGATLAGILLLSDRSRLTARALPGSWPAAAALCGYAIAFSYAYLPLGAGTGALILFAAVQIGMLGAAAVRGERPGGLEWAGFVVACVSLGLLLAPGATAPDPFGALLMIGAGLAWAAYTLIGRGARQPLAETAGNFIRCVPVGLALVAVSLTGPWPEPRGLAYAILSGAVASGAGYAVWYAVLPFLKRSSAAFVQLTVPALAALGGVVLLGEPVSLRLVLTSAGILGGVAVALVGAERRGRHRPPLPPKP